MTTSVISWLAGTVRTLQKRIDALEASLELHTSTQNVIQLRSGRIPNPAKPVIISLETCLPLESAAAMKQTSTDTSSCTIANAHESLSRRTDIGRDACRNMDVCKSSHASVETSSFVFTLLPEDIVESKKATNSCREREPNDPSFWEQMQQCRGCVVERAWSCFELESFRDSLEASQCAEISVSSVGSEEEACGRPSDPSLSSKVFVFGASAAPSCSSALDESDLRKGRRTRHRVQRVVSRVSLACDSNRLRGAVETYVMNLSLDDLQATSTKGALIDIQNVLGQKLEGDSLQSLRELLHKQIDVRLSSEGLILMGHDEVAA
eukprot:TRINITY_DN10729_c0_g2_i2.p1 TRINITY_DN10729_c0_g2~~TRINITY_DN10729_c0_g2_i2.p1  ORF type:complete len:322 (+),score=42.56 TRINITY_DN10729_c0_g2_i2:86-1051(+)